MKTCRECCEEMNDEAIKCPHCHEYYIPDWLYGIIALPGGIFAIGVLWMFVEFVAYMLDIKEPGNVSGYIWLSAFILFFINVVIATVKGLIFLIKKSREEYNIMKENEEIDRKNSLTIDNVKTVEEYQQWKKENGYV